MYNTAIVLSRWMNLDGTLGEETKKRTDRSIDLYLEGATRSLTMSGLRDNKEPESPTSHAEAMKRYAHSCGVSEEAIFKEEHSLDTTGQAFFIKRDIIIPNEFQRLAVISSDYHMERVKAEFDFMFGGNYSIDYFSIDGFSTDQLLEDERRKIEYFNLFFKGINQADDSAIAERLFSRHALYRRLAS